MKLHHRMLRHFIAASVIVLTSSFLIFEVDVHWSSGKFCASGGGTLGDGTIRRVFAGSLWAAADG